MHVVAENYEQTHRHTHTRDNYSNSLRACAPRVNICERSETVNDRTYVRSVTGGPCKRAMKKMASAQRANATGSLRVKGHVGTISEG